MEILAICCEKTSYKYVRFVDSELQGFNSSVVISGDIRRVNKDEIGACFHSRLVVL